jgi:hypothetical protein
MKTKLIALVALAVAVFPFLQADVAEGAEFEVDATDAENLLTDGKAKLANATPAAPPAPANATPAAPPAPAKAVKKVKARVLALCAHGVANDLVELDSDEAKAAEAEGLIDTNKAAVQYAASLPQNQKPAEG